MYEVKSNNYEIKTDSLVRLFIRLGRLDGYWFSARMCFSLAIK